MREPPPISPTGSSLEVSNKADRTIHAYRLEIARLLRDNMDKPVTEYGASDIERWIISHPRKSRHISRAIASAFFTWLYLQERIEKNPMDKVVKVKATARPTMDIYSEAERALLEALPAPHGHLLLPVVRFGDATGRGSTAAVGAHRPRTGTAGGEARQG
jgi:site-specific recombinase XerD